MGSRSPITRLAWRHAMSDFGLDNFAEDIIIIIASQYHHAEMGFYSIDAGIEERLRRAGPSTRHHYRRKDVFLGHFSTMLMPQHE